MKLCKRITLLCFLYILVVPISVVVGSIGHIEHKSLSDVDKAETYLEKAHVYRYAHLYFLTLAIDAIPQLNERIDVEKTNVYAMLSASRQRAFSESFINSDINTLSLSWYQNEHDDIDCSVYTKEDISGICYILSRDKDILKPDEKNEFERILPDVFNFDRNHSLSVFSESDDPEAINSLLNKWAVTYHAKWVAYYKLSEYYFYDQDSQHSSSFEPSFFSGNLNLADDIEPNNAVENLLLQIGTYIRQDDCTAENVEEAVQIAPTSSPLGFALGIEYLAQYCSNDLLANVSMSKIEGFLSDVNRSNQRGLYPLLRTSLLINPENAYLFYRQYGPSTDATDSSENDVLSNIVYSALSYGQEVSTIRSQAREILARNLSKEQGMGPLFLVLQIASMPGDSIPQQTIRYDN